MALTKVLIILTCAVGLPVAALAQSPMPNMAATAECCASDDGSAAAAAVLLPPVTAVPTDACCQMAGVPAAAVDHSAHMAAPPTPAATPMTHAMGAMACCDHGANPAPRATADAGAGMKGGCDMPCCAGMPPKR
jgi:hypothetical protein